MNFPFHRRWLFSAMIVAAGSAASTRGADFARDPMAVPAAQKFTVSLTDYPGMKSPNPRGWYHHVANVVTAKDGTLVAVYRLGDSHTLVSSDIIVAYSKDGRTWTGHHSIAHADIWTDHGIWVAPQLSVLRDGRLVIVTDFGERTPKEDHPMLTDWQKPNRGMWNYVQWSSDNGRTWTKPEKIDSVGGEPGYVFELSDGTLAYTRTSSQKTTRLKNPPAPWNDVYYRNEIVLSHDGGKTWPESHWLADSPFTGDCEVGLAELSPGKLIAATRIGLGNGQFGSPSRLLFSDDSGRTWPRGEPAPFYGQRPHLGRLQSGNYLVTYRNVWGSPGNRAMVFDPHAHVGFQPTSYILEETRCALAADELTLTTAEGRSGAVEFNLYPAQDDRSSVEIEATLRVDSADVNGCVINAGCLVSFTPDRIFLTARPTAGFARNTREWHTYRVVRQNAKIEIFVDGVKKLEQPIDDLWTREVRFGNSMVGKAGDKYVANAAVSHWRSISAKVKNAEDYSINWTWTPSHGYPDQYRRDHSVILDVSYSFDSGYSSWTQMADGRIVILDFTNGGNLDAFTWGKVGEGAAPFVRSYVVQESDLVRR